MLHGRTTEAAAVERLVAGARAGLGGALVLRGEAGIGKTALLHSALRTADGMRVLQGAGYASEAEHPFAFLHLLLRSGRGRVEELPDPQARALRTALDSGIQCDEDRFQLRLAVLSLLSLLSAESPVLCVVDNAHWLDLVSADVLTFAARRLESERVAFLAACRDECALTTAGLRELRLCRLDHAATSDLLRERSTALAPTTQEKIVAESGGNPLAALELAGCLTPAQWAGRFNPFTIHDGGLTTDGTLQAEFRIRMAGLRPSVRTLLLLAAADDTEDAGLIAVTARALGVEPTDLGDAEKSGLLEAAGRSLRFTHPLARLVAYQHATTAERRAAHAALAEAAGDDQIELRAWHLASATAGRSEDVADRLEAVAERARAPRAYATYARAAELTPERTVRARRLVAAARAAVDAGLPDGVADLAAQAATLTNDPSLRARLARITAELESEAGRPRVACRALLDGAVLVRRSDPGEAVSMLLGAVRLGSEITDAAVVAEAATALRAVAPEAGSSVASEALPTWMSALVSVVASTVSSPGPDGPAEGARLTCELLQAVRAAPMARRLSPTAPIGLNAATGEGYTAAVDLVAERRRKELRGQLPYALHLLGQAQVHRGLHREAWATVAEGLHLATELRQLHRASLLRALLGWLAAVKGDEESCESLVCDSAAYASSRRIRPALSLGQTALALLALGLGRYEAALAQLESIGPGGSFVGAARRAPDQIEAAVRCGRPGAATRPIAVLTAWADRNPSSVWSALAERCRALIAAPEDAEHHFRRAVRLHEKCDQPYEEARTHLAYGEWLRRARRRGDARQQLTSALAAFERIGAVPWVARADAELRASGETAGPDRPAPGAVNGLTPQQLQVVTLAAAGASNRDIAARLCLSPRTVGNHLYRAFPKLGVKTRAELTQLDLDGLG